MNNFWDVGSLRQLHIELTNACNAACPMCVRFYKNSPLVRPDLEINQITLEKFQNYFPPEILNPLVKILFCGVHGDPCMASDLVEICEYIQSNTSDKFVLQVHTNGGMRNPEWWAKLGKVFASRNELSMDCWRVIFSVDGLEDTNHLYRRNVDWNKLTANIKAFIGAGGNAAWEYLIFEHNEHQIDEARKMSEEMGFKMFIPKAALGVDDGRSLKPLPALTREGKLDYFIEAPNNPELRNLKNPVGFTPAKFREFKIEDYRNLKQSKSNNDYQSQVENVYDKIAVNNFNHLDDNQIKCKALKEWGGKEVFIDNHGRVLPCCYVGTHINGVYEDVQSLQMLKHINDYGWDHFDLNKHSFKEILEAGHLNRVFADSWEKKRVKDGKLAYCSAICGEESRIDRVYFNRLT